MKTELEIAKELVEGIFGKEASEDSDIVKFYADVNSDSLQAITKELRATPKAVTDKILLHFLDSIRDYEHEAGKSIASDERGSEEFVKIYLNRFPDILEPKAVTDGEIEHYFDNHSDCYTVINQVKGMECAESAMSKEGCVAFAKWMREQQGDDAQERFFNWLDDYGQALPQMIEKVGIRGLYKAWNPPKGLTDKQ